MGCSGEKPFFHWISQLLHPWPNFL
jgi:hypothetical protein